MIKRFFITFLFLFAGIFAYSQRTRTFENWTSAAVQVKSNDFTFSAEQGWRIREFYLSRQTYTDLNFEYKISKMFGVSAGYRLILKPHLFSIYESNSRLYADATGTYEMGDLDLSVRIKFQYTSLGQEDDFQLPSETYFRNRLRAKYKVSDMISVSGSYEMLLILAPALNLITENRFALDCQFKLNKHNSLTAGYALRNYVQVEDPMNIHIMAIDYVYKF